MPSKTHHHHRHHHKTKKSKSNKPSTSNNNTDTKSSEPPAIVDSTAAPTTTSIAMSNKSDAPTNNEKSIPKEEEVGEYNVGSQIYSTSKSLWGTAKSFILFRPFMGLAESAASTVVHLATGGKLKSVDKDVTQEKTPLEELDQQVLTPKISEVDKNLLNPVISKVHKRVVDPVLQKGQEAVDVTGGAFDQAVGLTKHVVHQVLDTLLSPFGGVKKASTSKAPEANTKEGDTTSKSEATKEEVHAPEMTTSSTPVAAH